MTDDLVRRIHAAVAPYVVDPDTPEGFARFAIEVQRHVRRTASSAHPTAEVKAGPVSLVGGRLHVSVVIRPRPGEVVVRFISDS